ASGRNVFVGFLRASMAAVAPGARTASLTQAPVEAPASTVVEAAIKGYLDEWRPAADPLITLANGVQVKSSNFHGVELAGEQYYYRTRYQFSADPVSRGDAHKVQVVAVLDAGTAFETEIYRLIR
ncbi:MAG: hypothetical protein AAB289_16770, partial [Chloroflexota bacterium]